MRRFWVRAIVGVDESGNPATVNEFVHADRVTINSSGWLTFTNKSDEEYDGKPLYRTTAGFKEAWLYFIEEQEPNNEDSQTA